MRRLYNLVVLIGLTCFVNQVEAATKHCASGNAVALDGVVLRASPGNIDRRNVTNPFVALTAQEKAQGRKGTFCWLTPEQSSAGTQCSAAAPRQDRTNVFELERCLDGESVPLASGSDISDIAGQELVIRYTPVRGESRDDAAVLRAEWKGGGADTIQTFSVKGTSRNACSTETPTPLNGIKIEAGAGGVARRRVTIDLEDISKDDASKEMTLCWLTPAQQAAETTCTNAAARQDATAVFELERCVDGNLAPLPHGSTVKNLTDEDLFVSYTPPEGATRTDSAFLRVEQKDDDDNAKSFAIEGVSYPTFDPLYRLATYLGTTSSFSQGDFGKNFPELRLIVESRLVDGYEKCLSKTSVQECSKRGDKAFHFPDYWNFRTYGDVGLTSAVATAEGEQASFKARRAFDGTMGAGVGGSYNRATRPGERYTNRFSYALVYYMGEITIPATDQNATNGEHDYHNMLGIHVENENGYYEGAYFDTGIGRSDRFRFHRHNRWKTNAYLPFFRPGTIRLAVRLQVDVPSPWAKSKPVDKIFDDDGKPLSLRANARNLRDAGDFRITFLVAIDIKKLFGLAGVTGVQ